MANKRCLRRVWLALFGFALLLPIGAVQAQGAFQHSPFYAQTNTVLRAHAIEMLSARLLGVAALAAAEPDGADVGDPDADDDDLGEVIEALEIDYRRFAATLAAEDSHLAEDLDEAIGAVVGAHGRGDGAAVAAAAERAAGLVDRARQTVLNDAMLDDPALTAAVMAMLLTTENGGIGEGYEEAVEGELGPYAVAWAALARVKTMWSQLEPLANETQRFEVEDMLEELDALFPNPRPGPQVERSDPEEAEGATQRIAGFLEEVANADLFPSRDLGQLLLRVREVTGEACTSYEAGEDAAGLESISNAAYVYGEYLGNTLSLFAPEAAGEAQELYDALAPGAMGEEEGDDDEEAEEDDEEDEADPLTGQAAIDACRELVEHLESAGGPLGI